MQEISSNLLNLFMRKCIGVTSSQIVIIIWPYIGAQEFSVMTVSTIPRHLPSFEQTMAAWMLPVIEKPTHLYMLKTVLPLCMRYTYTSSTSSCFIMLKVKKYTPEKGRYLFTFILIRRALSTVRSQGEGPHDFTLLLLIVYVVCRFFLALICMSAPLPALTFKRL